MSAAIDLVVTRTIDAPVDAVWRAFTDHLSEWWCPRPWTTEVVALDLRPGGRSAMVMRGPAGEEHAMEGVFLEVVPARRIVFTDAYRSGWEPQGPFMTAIMEFTPEGDRTLYRGTARHWTAEAKAQHEAMGFEAGWGTVAMQLEEVARRITAGG
ncbi:SRPBCC family protein [Sphingomonas nostoxanthinifaciens]|uniref:SRPBCC family protein n=1 Tax=Sphingomonas nostoxanthinifaciens TaxID=2872652 RepID=UPI001CC1F495|nr:SRPBCC family protein [Sphingomonas nostoxanthinifaciens]UAK24461.1 SRPBCC family protein [Sphingomonas nostoxanthinifaciens]